MSHELRTPLNSSLILAKLLADNKHGNLSDEQVRYAATIHSSNNDLLALINDILDLSKVEAGQMDVQFAPVAIDGMLHVLARLVRAGRRIQGLKLRDGAAPRACRQYFVTDNQRLQQVLRNLLSNAFKFTERGQVTVSVHKAENDDNALRFDVRDTGIGIPREQAGPDLPGIPASRRHHQPQIRRHRPGSVDLAGIRASARRPISVTSEPGMGSMFSRHIAVERTRRHGHGETRCDRPYERARGIVRSVGRNRRSAPCQVTRRRIWWRRRHRIFPIPAVARTGREPSRAATHCR